uniref:TGF-beta propeptide domain-containing protein n=1 Tax=Anopheles culicifacies TaxID=139723 RepID=A0A182MDH7_9DIPT
MLLTSLLSSACSLAVPSAAQKHFASGGDQHGTLPASSSSTTLASTSSATVPIVRPAHPAATAAVASLTLLHQHPHHERKQYGRRRPVDPSQGSSEDDGEGTLPDLYNLTLTAMRQYLRNHLNASRLGKAPRKRSHVHVDAVDVEFYRRFKEFNTSQAVLDGVANHLATVAGTNGSQVSQEAPIAKDDPDEPLAIITNVTPEPSPATSSSTVPSAGTGQRDYSVLMDDPRGYITVSSSFPLRPGKTSTTWNTTFAQHRASISLSAGETVDNDMSEVINVHLSNECYRAGSLERSQT